jgi:hypothetical protein
MAKKLQNKWLTKEQYMDIEEAIGEEQGTERKGYDANLKITTRLVAKYPSLADLVKTAHLSTLITSRRAYMKRRAAGTFSWQKKSNVQPSEVGELHPLLEKEETPSSVRPHMDRSSSSTRTRDYKMNDIVSEVQVPTVTPADFHIDSGKLKASSKINSIQNWTMHSATFTNTNGSVITIQLDDSSANLSSKKVMNILKNIL